MSCISCGKQRCQCTKVISKQGARGRRGAQSTTAGPQGPAGPSTPQIITVKNTVFVMKNGNNSTGLVERLDKPFLTFAAARSAALSAFTSRSDSARIRIVAESGTYAENIILDKFIDFDLGNAVIHGGITDNHVDFGASDATVWTNIIYGQAKVVNTAGDIPALLIYNPNTKILVHCDTLAGTVDDGVAILNGIVKIYANRIYTNATAANYQIALELGQGYFPEDGFTQSIVEIIGADIFNVSSALAPPIAFTSGGASKNQTLSLRNCRVKSVNNVFENDGANSAISCGIVISSNGTLRLEDTILFSAHGKSIYTETGRTLVMYNYNSGKPMANRTTGGAGTLTDSLTNPLVVNSNVEPGF